MFTPEFRNRLDAVIQFGGLDPVTIERVVDKLIIEVEAQLEQKRVPSRVDDEARRWIAEQRLRPEDGRPPDGAHDPGVHQAAARRGAAVRQARRRRHVEVTLSEDGDKLKLDAPPADEPGLCYLIKPRDGVQVAYSHALRRNVECGRRNDPVL